MALMRMSYELFNLLIHVSLEFGILAKHPDLYSI
jgi:hypothetical protein